MLWARIASALVLGPVALLVVWYGSPSIVLVTAALAALMAWEWEVLVGASAPALTLITVLTPAASLLTAGFSSTGAGAVLAIAGIVVRVLLSPQPAPVWRAAGLAWIILGCLLFVWLRELDGGRNLLLWLLIVVWAIDTGAFVFGKLVGGPRLARHISPNKTWAGLAGGILCAFGVGAGMASLLYSQQGMLWPGVLGAALALVEQTGDFAESFAKRRFGAKDSGSLIPGHGGALDRLDGMIAVIVVVGLVKLIEAKVW